MLFRSITALQKFLVSDADFSSSANEKAIQKSFAVLTEHLDHLGQGTFKDDPALKVNLSLLQSHVKDASRSFGQGSKSFARYMMQSSLQMCIACHTRKKAVDFSWPEPNAKDLPPIDRADYFFATRQFQKGLKDYEEIVNGYPGNHAGQWNLRKSLLAVAVYYARVSEDPAAGATFFKKVSERDDLPQYLREELAAWSKEFRSWSKEKPGANLEKMGERELLAKAKKILRHDDFSIASSSDRSFHVRRLRASAILQRVLESPGEKSPLKADALLLLGQIYPRLSASLFFRFGDMYLKACITDYPKTSVARSCYVALEHAVTEGYTGSAGTNVPEDEQVELMRLKRLAY